MARTCPAWFHFLHQGLAVDYSRAIESHLPSPAFARRPGGPPSPRILSRHATGMAGLAEDTRNCRALACCRSGFPVPRFIPARTRESAKLIALLSKSRPAIVSNSMGAARRMAARAYPSDMRGTRSHSLRRPFCEQLRLWRRSLLAPPRQGHLFLPLLGRRSRPIKQNARSSADRSTRIRFVQQRVHERRCASVHAANTYFTCGFQAILITPARTASTRTTSGTLLSKAAAFHRK